MITVLRSVHCDMPACGRWIDAATDITAAELRREVSRHEGWSRRGKQDLCDRCTERAQGDDS